MRRLDRVPVSRPISATRTRSSLMAKAPDCGPSGPRQSGVRGERRISPPIGGPSVYPDDVPSTFLELRDDRVGEASDRIAVDGSGLEETVSFADRDVCGTSPGHAHRAGHPQLLGGPPVQIDAGGGIEPDDDLEGVVL